MEDNNMKCLQMKQEEVRVWLNNHPDYVVIEQHDDATIVQRIEDVVNAWK